MRKRDKYVRRNKNIIFKACKGIKENHNLDPWGKRSHQFKDPLSNK